MRLPSGSVVTRVAPTNPQDFVKLLTQLAKQSFNGYVAWTGRGSDGLEEGVFLFNGGFIDAVSYEHLKYSHVIDGPEALMPALNVLLAENPCLSVVGLDEAKVKLVLVFNSDAKLQKPLSPKDIKIPDKYSDKWARESLYLRGGKDDR